MHSRERCLTQLKTQSGHAVYVFSPSLFCLVPPRIKRSFSFVDRAKLMLRVIRGYQVYYQVENGETVSYCFLKRNYLHKYAFLPKHAVLINPYYVAPSYRGQGLGGKLISAAISDKETTWKSIYAVVKSGNLPSIRTLEKLNFQAFGYSEKRGWSHRLTIRQTNLPVFCLTRTDK